MKHKMTATLDGKRISGTVVGLYEYYQRFYDDAGEIYHTESWYDPVIETETGERYAVDTDLDAHSHEEGFVQSENSDLTTTFIPKEEHNDW